MTTHTPKSAQKSLFFIFSLLGILSGLWAANIPQLEHRLNLSPELLGACLFCFGIGAVIATLLMPKYIERHHSARVLRVSGCMMWLTLPLVLNAPSIATLMLLVCALGFCCGTFDISINTHALTVEHGLQKPSMSLFHGGYSLGNVAGSLCAAAMIALHISIPLSSLGVSVFAIAALIIASRFCYPTDTAASNHAAQVVTRTKRMPAALITVAILVAITYFSEGAVGDWSGLFLRDIKHATPTQTALTVAAFASGMTIARFAGDALRQRYATLPLLCASAACACIMMLVFINASSPAVALAALFICGLGYANIVPLLFIRAANIPQVPAAQGISYVAGMGYASLLGGPALLGYLAQHLGLPAAMLVIAIGAAFILMEGLFQLRGKASVSINKP
jgi:predicted MFS family arabinose efflux permease